MSQREYMSSRYTVDFCNGVCEADRLLCSDHDYVLVRWGTETRYYGYIRSFCTTRPIRPRMINLLREVETYGK